MIFDFKRQFKDLYQPQGIAIIDVPKMIFLSIDGKGNPNNNLEYAQAIELLYGLSYAIKMKNKHVFEYIVPPLEGFWRVDDASFKGGSALIDKDKFLWTMMIRQPDFVTEDVLERAKEIVRKKSPHLNIKLPRLETVTEGLCVQTMHKGSYDSEHVTVATIDKYAADSGYVVDIGEFRHHHEIYLSDPRKVAEHLLKTIIRHPIKLQ